MDIRISLLLKYKKVKGKNVVCRIVTPSVHSEKVTISLRMHVLCLITLFIFLFFYFFIFLFFYFLLNSGGQRTCCRRWRRFPRRFQICASSEFCNPFLLLYSIYFFIILFNMSTLFCWLKKKPKGGKKIATRITPFSNFRHSPSLSRNLFFFFKKKRKKGGE